MTRQTVVTLVAILCASRSAMANPPTPPHTKSNTDAIFISLGATLVPAGIGAFMIAADKAPGVGGLLIGAGALLGPSFGRVYAADRKPFSMMPLRLGGAGVGFLGLVLVVAASLDEYESNDGLVVVGTVAFFAGGATYLTGTVIDFVKGPKAVDRYNHRAAGVNWQLRPAYYAASHAVGANLAIGF